jgi:Protein of unknown function (DUF2865)
VFTRRHFRSVFRLALAGATALAVLLPPAPASAQGLFNFLFGSPRREAPRAYADPYPGFGPSDRRSESGGPGTYCVRLCDGRYFPLPRSGGASAAQLCSSFCPAATTRVFSGGSIDYATASDGTRYANLQTAFVYRDKIVADCSCNGRDPYGLATLNPEADPTLRNGDIVATNQGFVAYQGGGRQSAEFTRIDGDAQRKLADTKIVPANATPVPPQPGRQGAALGQRDRHVQLDR